MSNTATRRVLAPLLVLVVAVLLTASCTYEGSIGQVACDDDDDCDDGAICEAGYCTTDDDPDPDAGFDADVEPDVCDPISDEEFCIEQDVECGEVSGTDNCDESRTVVCDTFDDFGCDNPETCDDDTNTCSCPEISAELACDLADAECGTVDPGQLCPGWEEEDPVDCDGVDDLGCTEAEECSPDTDLAHRCECQSFDPELACDASGVQCGIIDASDVCDDWDDVDVNCDQFDDFGCAPNEQCGEDVPNMCDCPCVIDGDCFADGDHNPDNECQICAPDTSEDSFTDLDGNESCDHDIDDAIGQCQSGSCEADSCVDDLDLCVNEAVCTDLNTDRDNCGDCGTECSSDDVCYQGDCAECGDDGDCAGEYCDTSGTAADNQCVECLENDHCGSDVCDTSGAAEDNQCVECVDNDDCGSGFDCDQDDNTCFEVGCVPGDPVIGEGTDSDPYLLCDAGHLDDLEGAGSGDYFLITDDFALDGFDGVDTFGGNLDGDGHTLSNLDVGGGNDDVGFFGTIEDGATVEHLELTGADVTGDDNVGILAGTNEGTIERVHASGDVDAGERVGGLVGYNDGSGTIRESSADVDVTGDDVVGGLVGEHGGDIIERSFASGEVTGDDAVGGFAGISAENIDDSYAASDVNGDDATGGFIGEGDGNHDISRCYAYGSVTERDGNDEPDGDAGAFIGDEAGPQSINDSYWNETQNGDLGDNSNAEGLEEGDDGDGYFGSTESFPNWDFGSDAGEPWVMDSNLDRPVLYWE